MKKTILRKNNQMTRYSREEIKDNCVQLISSLKRIEGKVWGAILRDERPFLDNIFINISQLVMIINQLLEENRILREGLGKIENNISIICAPINEAYILKEIARETTAKADEVGKEKG